MSNTRNVSGSGTAIGGLDVRGNPLAHRLL